MKLGAPEIVGTTQDEPCSRVAGDYGIVQRRLTDGAAQAADVPVPFHGVQQEPIHDRSSAAAARRSSPAAAGLRPRLRRPRKYTTRAAVRLRRGRLAHRQC